MKKPLIAAAIFAVVAAGALLVPVGGQAQSSTTPSVPGMDMSSFSPDKPSSSLRLLFLHHSCGGQLFADNGPEKQKADCILVSHQNGGGLRKRLEANNYEVHEASYGSELAEKTDLFDWLPLFSSKMDKVTRCDFNDSFYQDARRNQIVMFKSCYPNSRFVGVGSAPGNPNGTELTLWNAKATMNALLPVFDKYPSTLFVYVTAPPIAAKVPSEPAFKHLMKTILRRPQTAQVMASQAAIARDFNNWMKSPDGWLKGYPNKNVVVFDYFDLLTQDANAGTVSNFLRYPTGDGSDSHPASEGQQKVADAFVPFINRAVRRAGLSQ